MRVVMAEFAERPGQAMKEEAELTTAAQTIQIKAADDQTKRANASAYHAPCMSALLRG